MANLKRKYSVNALAEAGAFVRMQELQEEMEYLSDFLHRTDPGVRRRRARYDETDETSPPVVPLKKKRKTRVVPAEPPPEIVSSNDGSVRVPGLRKRVTQIVRASSQEMSPSDVLKALARQGQTFDDALDGLRAVQAALRHAKGLVVRKTGEYRAAPVFYASADRVAAALE